ncbi:MAG: hypothetical protein WCV90_07915 [Candidatus Woesearchaeota archaeon]|jgi:hypothetical protein
MNDLSPLFQLTNESLEAVMAGLEVNEEDRVLAICGSGDQALAILETAHSVLAVDRSPLQVEYALSRINALKRGDIERFLYAEPEAVTSNFDQEKGKKKRDDYFLREGRLLRIASKLDQFELRRVEDVSDALNKDQFNKIYLSNILSYGKFDLPEIMRYFSRLIASLPLNGLIYISDHEELWAFSEEYRVARNIKESLWPKNIKVNPSTSLARMQERFWSPSVYQKVEELSHGSVD